MLIDNTFFVGEIYLANIDTVPVAQLLNYMIEERERELLTDMLGLELYTEFMEGLAIGPVQSKWLKLLYGDGKAWPGLVRMPGSRVKTVAAPPVLVTISATGNAFTLPPELSGATFTLEYEGERYYQGVDFTTAGVDVTTVTFTVTAGTKAVAIPFSAVLEASPVSKRSPIAHFVYYWYLVREAEQTTGVGQAATKSTNSVRVNPMSKMVKAWNELVDMLHELCEYMESNKELYPTWKTEHCPGSVCGCKDKKSDKYAYINTLDL